MGLITAESVGC